MNKYCKFCNLLSELLSSNLHVIIRSKYLANSDELLCVKFCRLQIIFLMQNVNVVKAIVLKMVCHCYIINSNRLLFVK